MAKIRGGLGLDNLSINSNGSGSGSNQGTTTSVEGGRYVAPGVYVGARQGASADSSRGVVEWRSSSTPRSRATSAPIQPARSA